MSQDYLFISYLFKKYFPTISDNKYYRNLSQKQDSANYQADNPKYHPFGLPFVKICFLCTAQTPLRCPHLKI